jgi:hypothetical protein
VIGTQIGRFRGDRVHTEHTAALLAAGAFGPTMLLARRCALDAVAAGVPGSGDGQGLTLVDNQ